MDPREIATLIPRLLIRLYQIMSSGLPRRCRFAPSCSEYTLQALHLHGLGLGLWKGLRRILKCHPWNAGGYDPVEVTPAQAGVQSSGLDAGFRQHDIR